MGRTKQTARKSICPDRNTILRGLIIEKEKIKTRRNSKIKSKLLEEIEKRINFYQGSVDIVQETKEPETKEPEINK